MGNLFSWFLAQPACYYPVADDMLEALYSDVYDFID